MCVVDGPADEVIPEQHGHLEVCLLGRHVSRHGHPEGPSPENHHLRNPPLNFSQSDPARKRASKSKPRESVGVLPCACSRGRRCGCGGARSGTTGPASPTRCAPRGDGPCGRSCVARRRRRRRRRWSPRPPAWRRMIGWTCLATRSSVARAAAASGLVLRARTSHTLCRSPTPIAAPPMEASPTRSSTAGVGFLRYGVAIQIRSYGDDARG